MNLEEIVEALRYMEDRGLVSRKQFTQYRHFRDNKGNALEPSARSLPRVSRKCVGGGIIEALSVLGINKDASSSSDEYDVVMSALADTLGISGSSKEKVRAVWKFNNEKGFEAVRDLVRRTITRLQV